MDLGKLILEDFAKQFVGFIKEEHFNILRLPFSSFDHVEYAPGCPRNNMLSILKFLDVLVNGCPSDACAALHVHMLAKSQYNRLDLCCDLAGW